MNREKLQRTLLSKRTLYLLCFMAANLIGLLRQTQRGDVWCVVVNCTGLVVMVLVASAYPLRNFCTLPNGIYTAVCFAAMMAILIYWSRNMTAYNLWQIETAAVNVWWIGIMAGYMLKRMTGKEAMRVRPGIMGWLWIIMSVLMIVSASQRLWPLWYLLMFGIFYLTKYKPEDRKALLDGMLNGTIFSFFLIQIYAYGFRPYDVVRYTGAFSNSNDAALYYLIVYLMCLCKLHVLELNRAHRAWKLFYLIGAGGMLSFQVYTLGRTAWVVSFVITVLYGIFVVRKIWKKKWQQVILRGAALGLSAVLTFLPVYYTIRLLPAILHHPIWYEGEYSIHKVHSFDGWDSDKYVSLDEFLETMLGRIANTLKISGVHDPFALRVLAAEQEQEKADLVDVTWTEDEGIRTRLTIYKVYWDHLTWYGNAPDKGYYQIGDSGYVSWHAQNLWLQTAYYYGIPAGILMIVLSGVMVWHHGRILFTNREDPYAVIPFFVCILYMLFGATELVWNLGQLIMFLIFFVQHPQVGGGVLHRDAIASDGS